MEFVTENKAKFEGFRVQFPEFIYRSYSWTLAESVLTLSFTYEYSPLDIVTSVLVLTLPSSVSEEKVALHEDFIFRIGLIEALSYWKAYCSPRVRVMCGAVGDIELAWWKETWFEGMGEFRYRNGLLDVTRDDWVAFSFEGDTIESAHDFSHLEGNLIAFTGGKDSTLALGLLRDSVLGPNETFFVSASAPAREAVKEILEVEEYPETCVARTMHPRLLALNAKGALNGHTPFSIAVAFLGMLSASLRGRKYVIVANEASADQPTVPGTDINHQYSKSLHFEKRFQELSGLLWAGGPEYFSILRPFSEIGIAGLLKRYEDALPFVSSCNVKNKSGLWCGACAKCLFAFILFSAEWNVVFAENLFEKNMFADVGNLTMLEELTGLAATRPFECVGTTQESLAIISWICTKLPEAKEFPLLAAFLEKHRDAFLPGETYKSILCEFHEHAIPDDAFVDLLKNAQDEVCYG